MKKNLQFIALFLAILSYSQQISNYQYILIPQKFEDKKTNKYGLKSVLQKSLTAKNFIILNGTLDQQPPEITSPCEILKAEITDSSNFITNKTRVTFTNCEDKIVATFDGKSSIKDLQTGMQDALLNTLVNISPSAQIKQNFAGQKAVISSSVQETENPVEREIVSEIKNTDDGTSKIATKSSDKAEIYANKNVTFNKIILENGAFILASPAQSIPFATFKPSTKREVYRVKLADQTATLGYVENGSLVIEMPNSDGSFRKEIFEKK